MPAAELTQKWWSKNKPVTLKSTGLGKKIKAYEDALAALQKLTKDADTTQVDSSLDACDKALKDLGPAIDTAKKACNKTLHKDVIKILDEYKSKTLPAAAKEVMAIHSKLAAGFEEKLKALKDDVDKAAKYIQEQDKKLGKALEQGAKISRECSSLGKDAAKAAAKGDKSELDKIDKRVSELAQQLLTLKNACEQEHEKKTKPNFYRMLPRKSKHLPKGHMLGKEIHQTETIYFKVEHDVTRFVDLERSVGTALDIVNEAKKGNLDQEASYRKMVADDIDRMREAMGQIGGAESSIDTQLKQAAEFLSEHAKASGEDKQTLERKVKVIEVKVKEEMPRWDKLVKSLVQDLRGTLQDYPKDQVVSNAAFKKEMKEVGMIGKFVQDQSVAVQKQQGRLDGLTKAVAKL